MAHLRLARARPRCRGAALVGRRRVPAAEDTAGQQQGGKGNQTLHVGQPYGLCRPTATPVATRAGGWCRTAVVRRGARVKRGRRTACSKDRKGAGWGKRVDVRVDLG